MTGYEALDNSDHTKYLHEWIKVCVMIESHLLKSE